MPDDAGDMDNWSISAAKNPAAGRKPISKVGLFLQGGAALGSYECGVYEALAEIGLHPDILGCASIGAINGSVIAGNRAEERVPALRKLWTNITRELPDSREAEFNGAQDGERLFKAKISAAIAQIFGVPGLAEIKTMQEFWKELGMLARGDGDQASVYSNRGQKPLLESLADFQAVREEKYGVHLGVAAVDFHTGELKYLESGANGSFTAESAMASAALHDIVPPVEKDGKLYVDGGVRKGKWHGSNNPRAWAVEKGLLDADSLSIKVHLFDPDFTPHTDEEVKKRKRHRMYGDKGEDLKAAKGFGTGFVIDIKHHTQPSAPFEETQDFARNIANERWNWGYDDAMTAICRSPIVPRLKPEIIERLAPHLFNHRSHDLAQLGPDVLKILGSKPVMDQLDRQRHPLSGEPEHLLLKPLLKELSASSWKALCDACPDVRDNMPPDIAEYLDRRALRVSREENAARLRSERNRRSALSESGGGVNGQGLISRG